MSKKIQPKKKAAVAQHLTQQQKQELDVEIQKVKQTIKAEVKKVKQNKITPYAKALLANLTLPSDAPAVRVGSAFGSDPTALANLRSRESVVYPTSGLTNEIAETEYLAFQFRDPLRNLVHVQGITALTIVEYEAPFDLDVNNGPGEWFPDYITPFTPAANDNSNLHGDAMFLGVLSESDLFRGFHVSNGFTVTVTLDALASYWTNVYVDLYRLEGKGWSLQRSGIITPPAPAATIFTSVPTGYYAIKFRTNTVTSDATGASVQLQGLVTIANANTLGMAWAHKAAPQIADFKENIETFAVLGSSLMYTNTASPLNRQGKIVARELPAKTNWHNFTDFDTVANQSLAVVKDAPLGLYGFIRPGGDAIGKFRTLQYDSGNVASDTSDDEFLFSLYPEEPYLVIHASVTTAAGRDAYLTRCLSMEYTSLTMFIEQTKGFVSEDDLKVALKLLGEIPQFHENPFHFSDVWDWIKDTAKDVWGAVKDVAPIAMAAAPLLL